MIKEYWEAAKFRFNKYPSHLVLFVTARCNLKCKHCFYWQEIQSAKVTTELTLEEIEKITKKMGPVKLLSITGGEPTLRNDLPEIVSLFVKNNKTQNLVLHTNGFFSKRVADVVSKIASANPKLEINVSLSLDGTQKTHDHIRQVDKSFDNAIETIKLVTAQKKDFKRLNMTVTSVYNYFNQEDVRKLSDYLLENFDLDGYYLSLIRGDSLDKDSKKFDVNKYLKEVNYLNRRNVIDKYYKNYPFASFRRAIDFLAPKIVAKTVKKNKQYYPCQAGKSVIVISEEGEVKPCEMLTKSFGNLRENDFDVNKLLFSDHAKEIKEFIYKKKCVCTWECAIMNNLVFTWNAFPMLMYTWFQLEFKRLFGRT